MAFNTQSTFGLTLMITTKDGTVLSGTTRTLYFRRFKKSESLLKALVSLLERNGYILPAASTKSMYKAAVERSAPFYVLEFLAEADAVYQRLTFAEAVQLSAEAYTA